VLPPRPGRGALLNPGQAHGPGPPMTDVLSLRRSGPQPSGDTRERRDSRVGVVQPA
jgi:hypothetical protein